MKNILIIFLIIAGVGHDLQAQITPAEQLAAKIAQRMKDSLLLSDSQTDQIYNINIDLHNQKMTIRQTYTHPDSLRLHFQRVENRRDSLYRPVFNEEKYLLYRQKKRYLISNN